MKHACLAQTCGEDHAFMASFLWEALEGGTPRQGGIYSAHMTTVWLVGKWCVTNWPGGGCSTRWYRRCYRAGLGGVSRTKKGRTGAGGKGCEELSVMMLQELGKGVSG